MSPAHGDEQMNAQRYCVNSFLCPVSLPLCVGAALVQRTLWKSAPRPPGGAFPGKPGGGAQSPAHVAAARGPAWRMRPLFPLDSRAGLLLAVVRRRPRQTFVGGAAGSVCPRPQIHTLKP